MLNTKTMEPENKTEQFIYQLSTNQRKIFSYILSSVLRRDAAEEIMQNALLEMWRNFHRFKDGTNFAAWGKEVAKYQIYNYRKKKAKYHILSAESVEKIFEISIHDNPTDQRKIALEGCLKKVDEKNRQLIFQRYHEGYSCSEIADKIGRPLSTVYKRLSRLHASLQECVRSTTAIWEAEL